MAPLNINTITASAGAGKTTRIVSEIANEVKDRPPEELVATTFTVKAADELIERARAQLFVTDQADKAVRLLGARFGTVNSVCGQIVAEHAFELGRSPRADVISEESIERILATAASEAISKHAPVLNRVADTFGYFEPTFFDRPDWRKTLNKLMDLARANGISPQDLKASADKSVQTFLALLRPLPPGVTEEQIDQALVVAVDVALSKLPATQGGDTKKAIAVLRKAKSRFNQNEPLNWVDWARLSKAKATKKDGTEFGKAIELVNAAASIHPSHPRLRRESELFIRTLFECTADSMTAYAEYKSTRGLVDFTDQEMLAREVIANPAMRKRLAERVSRVFVDEFQDSSPLQIAIFTSLAEIVDISTWVGDPKQAIYGFRGADSNLTQAAFLGAGAGTKAGDPLLVSYRSRKGIIDLVNAAFEPSLTAMGLSSADHKFSGTKREEAGFTKSPLAVWPMPGAIPMQSASLAEGVRNALANPDQWPVDNRNNGVRPLSVGDIAILCRTQAEVSRYAAALSQAGIPVAVDREQLSATPHVEVVLAALRWVADQSDRLALAELARFFSDDPHSDTWLQAIGADDPVEALKAANPISGDLDSLREKILALTPAEMVDAIIALPPLMSRVERWGAHSVRLDDLEALRGYARKYETECTGSGKPATLSDLIISFGASKAKRPKSLRPDAVKVMTYHSAKGLEWPMVILTSMNWEPKPHLYDPTAEADSAVDWLNPLKDRWIRYWPWPYGPQEDGVGLDAAAENSELGRRAIKRTNEEETRLLYVGITRARDYAVFAPSVKNASTWPQVLDAGAPAATHLSLPGKAGDKARAGTLEFDVEVTELAAPDEVAGRIALSQTHVRVTRPAVARKPLFRRPSSDATGVEYIVKSRIDVGPRIGIVGNADMAMVGEAVHAIMAADNIKADRAARIATAGRILQTWGVSQVQAEDILKASDALHAYIQSTWKEPVIQRETPVSARIADQLISGRIDLLVGHSGGYAIIDHKSFPGAQDKLDEKATGYGMQLSIYGDAVTAATGKPVTGLLVHMPIVGKLIEVVAKT